MKTIEVFDPAMCCSTGVCGPGVDPALARFAADLDWLAGKGATIRRFNLAQEPGAFVEREVVSAALHAEGEKCLPLVLSDGQIVSERDYPSRAALAGFAGLEPPAGIYTAAIDQLVAVGAAIASNCEPCLDYHVSRAREVGIPDEDIARAVRTARKVKETPARSILRLADELLGVAVPSPTVAPLPVVASNGGGCCSDEAEPLAASSTQSSAASCC
jgi:AhpD family alkylhydroperoxidase